jgi:flagellar motor switch protein FliN/FliY
MSGDPEQIGQDEIEQLLRQAQQASKPAAPPPAAPPPSPEVSAAADMPLGQADIEALLGGSAKPATAKPAAFAAPPPVAAASAPAPPLATRPAPAPPKVALPKQPAAESRSSTGDDVSLLLAQAEAAIASVDQPENPLIEGLKPFTMEDFGGSPPSAEKATLELLRDVELDLRIELGRAEMYLEDVLKLKCGSVVTLDKLAGDPVDVYVNGRLVARGEVLVLNDNFCVRVAELLSGDDWHGK